MKSNTRGLRAFAVLTVVFTCLAVQAIFTLPAYGDKIVGWGQNSFGEATPPPGDDFTAIAAGGYHSLALKSDGSIVCWGDNSFGQATPPAGSDFIAVAAGIYDSLALRSDGSIIAWGLSSYGEATPPVGNDFTAISAGQWHSLALKSDGSIVGWGVGDGDPYNYGQATPPSGNDFTAIAAGGAHGVALKSNGGIVGWGSDPYGEATPPAGSDFIAIAAGWEHGIALKSDGGIVGWGLNSYGQATAPAGNNFTAVAAGGFHSLALVSTNSPPVADAGGPYTGEEGSEVTFHGTGSTDPDGDSLTYAWDFGDGQTGSGPTPSHIYADNGEYEVCLTVTDTAGASDTKCTTATIANVAPTVGPIGAPVDPVQLGSGDVCATAEFVDPGEADTHTAEWDWGDGISDPGTVDEVSGYGSVHNCHAYSQAGIYTITLTVKDDDGGSNQADFQYVVYDPEGRFVTGGGWVDSPAGAYALDPSLSGKANFGFVSKYKKGATVPTGQTEFVFQAGDLNFHSNSYDWLVVNQAGTNAQFKGSGTINGAGDYKFMGSVKNLSHIL